MPRENNQYDTLEIVAGTLALNLNNIDVKNIYRKFKMVTGPGVSIRGEALYESQFQEDRTINLECIISLDKDSFDKSAKEVEELKKKNNQIKYEAEKELKRKLDLEKEKHNQQINELLKQKEMDKLQHEKEMRKHAEAENNFLSQFKEEDIGYGTQLKNDPLLKDDKFQRKSKFGNDNEDFERNENKKKVYIEDSEKNIQKEKERERETEKESRRDRERERESELEREQEKYLDHYRDRERERERELDQNKSRFEHEKDRDYYRDREREREREKDQYKPRFEQEKDRDYYRDREREREREKDQYKSRFGEFLILKFLIYYIEKDGTVKEKENRIIFENARDMHPRDRAELISKGVLSLDHPKAESELLFENELKNTNKAYQFVFQFSAFKPKPDISNYNLIPNKIYFKFSVWEYEDIVTEVVVINKPSGNTVIPTSMPMILTRETAPMSVNTGINYVKI